VAVDAAGWLFPRALVINRYPDGLIDLFRCEKNDRFRANRSGRNRQRNGGSRRIVRPFGDHVRVVITECEVKSLEAATQILQHLFDSSAASCSALLDKSFYPFGRIGNHRQVLRHNLEQVKGSVPR
jgi:hypothetical protein